MMHASYGDTKVEKQVVLMVKEHVKRNIVKVGSKYYQQKVGTPQGNVLSFIMCLLCLLFYGHLDTRSFTSFAKF
jgi:telomerase reverse transcriptase